MNTPILPLQPGRARRKPDSTELAFYFMMSTLVLGLIYFLLLPFFI